MNLIYLSKPAPKRIRFEEEFQLPNFGIKRLYQREEEPKLLNDDGQFFVNLSEKTPYLREFVRQAQNLGLTVSGDGTAAVKGDDITKAPKNSLITVGSSSRFDVNWIRRDQYFAKRGYRPVYDMVEDWTKIEKALKAFADKKKNVTLHDGSVVRFHSRFMVVDGKIVPYNRNEIMVELPAARLNNLLEEVVIKINVVRNW